MTAIPAFLSSNSYITEHINDMKLVRIWGTDLEIHAAASLWQVNIYVCQPDTSDSSSWICFKPFSPAELVCPDECQQLRTTSTRSTTL